MSSSLAISRVTRWLDTYLLRLAALDPLDAGYYAVLRYRLGYHGIPLGPAAVAVASVVTLRNSVDGLTEKL